MISLQFHSFYGDCKFFEIFFLYLSSTYFYVVIKDQLSTQHIMTTPFLLNPSQFRLQLSLRILKPSKPCLDILQTSLILALLRLLIQLLSLLFDSLIEFNFKCMYLDIGIEVDESLIVHVDLIELTHVQSIIIAIKYRTFLDGQMYNQRILSFKMAEKGRGNEMKERRLYQQLLMHGEEREEEKYGGRPGLELEIQLENGSKVYINPNPTDEPVRLATEFCEEHNLDEEMIDILAESIKRSITHGSYKKQHLTNAIPPKQKKLNFIAQSCKTRGGKSPQYFSKKFSVNSSLGLYEKGIMLEDAKKHWVARQHEHQKIEELRECTHKPRINALSRSLVSERPRQERPEKCASKDLLSLRSSILVQSKPSESTALQQRRSDCNISRASSSVFLKLYENRQVDEISRSKILSEMLREETHHPVINGISKEIVGSAKFDERLLKYEKSKLEKNCRLKKNKLMEKENLYRPKTGPPPPNRNIENLPIGDFLYNKKKKTPSIKTPKQQPHINQASKAIYQKRKNVAFQRIFDYLDFQNVGRIGWALLDSANIEHSLLAVLRPLLEEIQIMQIELSPQDFKAALQFLFGTLSPTDKGTILNFNPKSKKHSPAQHSSIQMNKNSSLIARSIGRSKFSIYDYCEIKQALRLQRLQNERIENERREMRQCTFQPNLHKKTIYY